MKEYIILGSNNFWYRSSVKDKNIAIAMAKEILSDDINCEYNNSSDPESGYVPEPPTSVYVYKVELVKELTNKK